MKVHSVNGKPSLDWVVERQCVKTDKDSGIVNNANAWALENDLPPKLAKSFLSKEFYNEIPQK